MLDTRGREITINNPQGKEFVLEAGQVVVLTTDCTAPPTSARLPVSFAGLPQAVQPGDAIFVGQYLFTGSETSSAYLTVQRVTDTDVVCEASNSATLGGVMFTVHLANRHVDMPALADSDLRAIRGWGARNAVDFLSLSFTQSAAEVAAARQLLDECGLRECQVIAKVENKAGLVNVDDIVEAADGVILSRGNLGVDLPPQKLFLVQRLVQARCADAGKPLVITRVCDSMTDAPRPTRAEATDVANAVLDGVDGFLLGAETLRGAFPVDTVRCVCRIAAAAERVFNGQRYYHELQQRHGGPTAPFSHVESLASSAVRAAEKVDARLMVVFTQTGRAARLVAKYRPNVPICAVVVPKLLTDGLKWRFTGLSQARQCLLLRGVIPTLADPADSLTPADLSRHQARAAAPASPASQEAARWGGGLLGGVIHRAGQAGLVCAGDRVVVVQRLGDTAVVKIVTYDGSPTLPQVSSTAEFGGGSGHHVAGFPPCMRISAVGSTASLMSVQERAGYDRSMSLASENEGSWSGEGE